MPKFSSLCSFSFLHAISHARTHVIPCTRHFQLNGRTQYTITHTNFPSRHYILNLWLTIYCRSPPMSTNSTSLQTDSSEPIPDIDHLYSPKFPLEVVREFVMEALQEAVEINQVHNRDPIGWTNENLFL